MRVGRQILLQACELLLGPVTAEIAVVRYGTVFEWGAKLPMRGLLQRSLLAQ